MPDGAYRLQCSARLAQCLERAERLCREHGGYWVSEAYDSQRNYGHESGTSRKEVLKSEALVYCGSKPPARAP
jgi:hypothetical protein